MVDTERCNDGSRIILRPNRSASWQSNRRIITTVATVNLIIASGFLAVGAWLILPFMGLEIFLLWYLLRRVFGRLQIQQIVSVNGDQLRVETGRFCAEHRRCWPRTESSILVTEQQHPWTPLEIHLCHHGETLRLGAFLNKDDCQKLLLALRQLGLPLRQFGANGELNA